MSFYDGMKSPEPGNEWRITKKLGIPVLDKSGCKARGSNDAVILLEYSLPGGKHELVRHVQRNTRYDRYEVFRIRLAVGAETLEFDVNPIESTKYPTSSARIQIRPVGARLQVEIGGIGKATYRNAWRDSDIEKAIYGFVDVESKPEFEEPLVWLAGVLGAYGLPQVLGD